MNTVKLRSLRLSLTLVFVIATLLRQANDVETNPGPNKSQATRQSKLSSSRRLSTSEKSDKEAPMDKPPQEEPSLSDIMSMLTGMKSDFQQRFDTMNGHFDTLNDSVTGLRH